MNPNAVHAAIVACAAIAAGFINALAGGGTLVTFPVLTLLGMPPIVANVTNTVALCPGYFGAAFSQRRLLAGQGRRLLVLAPVAMLGGVAGGLLLLATGEGRFRRIIPFLILFAALLLALQEPVKRFLGARFPKGRDEPSIARARGPANGPGLATTLLVAATAVYGGYFGAGASVIILAAIGLGMDEDLVRLGAAKQALALAVNAAAAVLFLFSGRVDWGISAIMAAGALSGGLLGGRLANRIEPALLRTIVVAFGAAIGLYYLLAQIAPARPGLP